MVTCSLRMRTSCEWFFFPSTTTAVPTRVGPKPFLQRNVFVTPSEDEEGFSDDDDISWKVRKAACKCLGTVISAHHDFLEDMFKQVGDVCLLGQSHVHFQNCQSLSLHGKRKPFCGFDGLDLGV